MKIGIDARLWNQTGVGRYIRNLIINLQKIDKKNHYILFVREEDLDSVRAKIINNKWRIIETNIKWHSLSEQINLPKVLEREYLDLMHFPYVSVPISYKKAFVVTIHDLIPFHFPTGKASTLPLPLYLIKKFGYEKVLRSAVINSVKIIVPLSAVKKDIVESLKISDKKIVVTKEGYDDRIRNSQTNFSNANYKVLDRKYFIYVGNAYPHKNLERLLDAFLLMQKQYKDVSLVFVGRRDFFYKRLMDKVREYGLEDKVLQYSTVSDNDLSVLYKNALALVFPSMIEGFGLPVLEAMAKKLAVITSDIPAIKELAKDSVIYFNPYEIEEIKRAMVYVYKGNYEKERLDKAFEFSKQFSWKIMAEETLKVYESSINLRQS